MTKKKSSCKFIHHINNKRKERKNMNTGFDCTGSVRLSPIQKRISQTALRNYPNTKAACLFLDVGVGKTLSSIGIIEQLRSTGSLTRVVVITKPGLINTYKDDLVKCIGNIPDHYTFTSYAGAYKLEGTVDANTIVVIDEVHNLRNMKTRGFRQVFEVTKRCGFVILLTATPSINSPLDLLSIINFIHAPVLRTYRMESVTEFSRLINGMYSSETRQINHNSPEFLEFMYLFVSSVMYVQRPPGLFPERITHEPIHVPMSEEQWQETRSVQLSGQRTIQSLMNEYGGSVEVDSTDVLNRFFNQTRRLANYTRLQNNELSSLSPKLQRVIRHILDSHERGVSPVVVYSPWKNAGIVPLLGVLNQFGLRTGFITGDYNISQRTATQDQYNNREIDVLGISAAGAEGLNLLRSREMHILDGNWNQSITEQAIGRTIRRNSHADLPENDRNVHIYYWISTIPSDHSDEIEKSTDELLFEMVQNKQRVISDIMSAVYSLSII